MIQRLSGFIGVPDLRTVALIGSRKAPDKILDLASAIGRVLSENAVYGVSGGARGMDTTFMEYYDPLIRKIYSSDLEIL